MESIVGWSAGGVKFKGGRGAGDPGGRGTADPFEVGAQVTLEVGAQVTPVPRGVPSAGRCSQHMVESVSHVRRRR